MFNAPKKLLVLSLFLPTLALSAAPSELKQAEADGSLLQPYTLNDCRSASTCPPGVYQFKPSDDVKKIQETLDFIYASLSGDINAVATYTAKAEWSNRRFALLFEPGTYDVEVKVNYYTELLGLGSTPAGVNLTNLLVDNLCFPGNIKSCLTLGALNNFWRGVTNVTFNPRTCRIRKDEASEFKNDKCVVWNVSQAAPMRQVVVNGDLLLNLAGCFDFKGQCLAPNDTPLPGVERRCSGAYEEGWYCGAGYASGGYFAQTKVNGTVHSIAQQQWFARDSSFNQWAGGVWNMVFLNTTGTLPTTATLPASWVNLQDGQDWPVFAITNETNHDLVVQEKPFLVLTDNALKVSVPGGSTYGLENLVVMNKDHHNVDEINAALREKNGLVIEPGVYQLSSPIRVPSGKFVLGIGLAELVCAAGNSCLQVSGSKAIVAGVMIAAGYQESETLLDVDRSMGNATSAEQATTLIDVFCRVGEASETRHGSGPTTKNCVSINADYVIGDNLWLWRADHDLASSKTNVPTSNLVLWGQDVSQHGLLVNGDHVTMLGLFSEHHLASNVLWNGNAGKTYFYQSELAYVVPTDWQCADFSNGLTGGCPSYMLGRNVTSHEGYGVAAYTFFQQNIMIPSAFLAPSSDGVFFKHIVARYLNASPAPVTESGISCLVKNYTGECFGPSSTAGSDVNAPARLPALGRWPVPVSALKGKPSESPVSPKQ